MKDAAIVFREHVRQHRLRDKQRAKHVDPVDDIEIVRVDLMRLEIGLPGDAGAIDHRVQLAVFADDAVPYRAVRHPVGDVDRIGRRLATGREDFVGGGASTLAVAVEADDLCAS